MSSAGHDRRPSARHERSPFPTSIPGAVTTGSPYFLVVVALFVTNLITANTVAVKILEFGPWLSDAGLLTFPIA